MTDYTKGPWQIVMVGDSNPKPAIATEDMISLMTIAYEDETPFAAVYELSDARLIAAAPEMLEALKLAKGWLELWESAERELGIINGVIAKAEGRSK